MSDFCFPHDHGHDPAGILRHMPSAEECSVVAEVFKQLSDPTRLRIFWVLCHSEECVINLSALMNMSSPAVLHHLKQLKAGGLVVSRKAGKEVYYTATDSSQAGTLHHMIEEMMQLVCPGQSQVMAHHLQKWEHQPAKQASTGPKSTDMD